ncbi:hypothetical protein G7K_5491-t1 [Saitoella complicata NRRL Y-17804]|uniref:Uncharacterized protein n=1 Tax=Saitoella complicata (strain BCRC 22490 / CBS 7301 / JCM 7358 / NBRC 10748 / NRRL Y-17804) TaxID=698492 RepID=A0A0E9NNI9_SAICN|nr:hypothetical protein G7K_5491-t1 [Saitoella complicata NRRL Y-17804]
MVVYCTGLWPRPYSVLISTDLTSPVSSCGGGVQDSASSLALAHCFSCPSQDALISPRHYLLHTDGSAERYRTAAMKIAPLFPRINASPYEFFN